MKKTNELSNFKKKFGYILEYKINNESNLMREDFDDDTIAGQMGKIQKDQAVADSIEEADETPAEPKPDASGDVKPAPTVPAPEKPKQEIKPDPMADPATPPTSVGNEPAQGQVMGNGEPNVNPQNDLMRDQVSFMEKFVTTLQSIDSNMSLMNQKMDRYQQELNKMRLDVEEVREPSDEEKLEMQSLKSYPYNQKLSDVFGDKFRNDDQSVKKEFSTEFVPNVNIQDKTVSDSFNDF